MKPRPSPRFIVASLAAILCLASQSYSQDRFFNQTNFGDFAVAANWQGSNPPSTGFANTFVGSSALGSPPLGTVTAYLDSDVTSWQTGSLFLGQGSSGNATLIISNGGSLQYGLVYIGRDAGAVGVVNQEGGTNQVNTGTFEIQSGGASGTYNLSGGVLNTIQAGNIAIKVGTSGSGTGYFNMSGGTFNAGTNFATQQHSLNVGWGAKGVATFGGGTANITGDLNAGNGSNGLVTVSGSALVNARNVNVGLNAGATNSRLTVTGGTLSVTNGIVVSNSSVLNMSGGTVSATGLRIASGSIMNDSGGSLNLPSITNNGSIVYSNSSGTLTRSNAISGSGAVTKSGAGSVTLTANNTYTGDTTVNAGSLIINGNQSSANGVLNVAAGATLGGSGTIGGATTISGVLAPGNSIGTLAVANDVTWNGGENWVFELGAAGPSIGSPGSSDLLAISGGNDFLKGTGSSFTFDFAGTGDVGWYKLVDWAGGTTTFDVAEFSGVNLASTYTSEFAIQDNALYVNVVPEPSTYALLAVAAAGFGAHVVRRRRR